MSAPATLPLLHRFLGIGLIVLAVVFVGFRYAGIEFLPPDRAGRSIGWVLVGLAAVLVAVALLVRAPRVPRRTPGRSLADYWATPDVIERVMAVWFLLEAAGILAAVSYLLVGDALSGVAVLLTAAVFFAMGPDRFAGTS